MKAGGTVDQAASDDAEQQLKGFVDKFEPKLPSLDSRDAQGLAEAVAYRKRTGI
jgi:hypothetical protein